MSEQQEPEGRPAGVWQENYRMPDGSRPVTAIDETGTARAIYYFMQPEDDEGVVKRSMENLLGQKRRQSTLEIVD